ncbi:hypothetical protein TGAMA5MH_08100 [Trichoderma gamsii]|uniref:Uncharacterized protein n=1 Tax=Trichoderma gamsii TaxID=398673 RepID=A0A2K0T2U9_9HYPO|nr:hypothetical protein TGAMA5MH_08100 [Trichoderma gamsii]
MVNYRSSLHVRYNVFVAGRTSKTPSYQPSPKPLFQN